MDHFISQDDISYEPVGEGMAPAPTPPVRFSSQSSAAGIDSIRKAKREGINLKEFPLKRTGGVALVRRPSMLSMQVNRQIPESLRPLVKNMLMRGRGGDHEDVTDEFLRDESAIDNMADLFRATAMAGFANPRLVPDDHKGPLPENAMYVSEIELEDLSDYWTWCNSDTEEKATAVAAFPERQSQSVSPRSRLEAVRSEAV